MTGLFLPPAGRTLASGSWDHQTLRWDLATGRAEPSGEGYAGHLQVTRSPDGQTIAVGDSSDRLELRWRVVWLTIRRRHPSRRT